MSILKDMTYAQLGTETAGLGTGSQLRVKLAGVTDFTIKPIVAVELIKVMRGTLGPSALPVITKTGCEASMSGPVIYDDLPYLLNSLFSNATGGSTSWSGSAYYYTAPTSGSPSPNTVVLSLGDGVYDYLAHGMLINKLNIKGESNKELTYSVDWIGSSGSPSGSSFTGLSDRTVTVVMGNDAALSIAASSGSLPGVVLTTTSFSFEYELVANREMTYHLGNKAPDGYHDKAWSGTLKLALELDSTSKAYMDAILAASSVFEKLVRIALTNGSHVIWLDFAGVQTEAPSYQTDVNGVVTLELNLTGIPDAGAFANFAKIQVRTTPITTP